MAKAKKAKTETETVEKVERAIVGQVPLRKLGAQALILRLCLAEGKTNKGRKFSVTSGLPTGSLLVEFAEPRAVYIMQLDDVVRAAVNIEEALSAAQKGVAP